MLELTGLRLPYTATEEELKQRAAELCRVSADAFLTFRISRRALDARKKQQISYLYNVTVSLPKKLEQQALRRKDDRIKACSPETDTEIAEGMEDCRGRIVVAGLGRPGCLPRIPWRSRDIVRWCWNAEDRWRSVCSPLNVFGRHARSIRKATLCSVRAAQGRFPTAN